MIRLSFFSTVLLASLALVQPARAADEPRIHADVVYGHKDGMALTFDVIQPEKPNGAAILWIQSGGWYSNWQPPKNWLAAGKFILDKGYTLFIVRHGSAPKYAIPDAYADVHRAVRVIRMKAKEFGVDSERLGVFGGSAGGHLSLMLGTAGDDGDPMGKDDVAKGGSRVAAVVALYPPTDLRAWVTDPPEIIKKNAGLKPPLTFDAKLAPEVSPLLKVTDKTPPILMIHGDKDELVPISHSKNMLEALEKAKVPAKLLTVEGAGHGYSQEQNIKIVVPAVMEWFDKYLAKKE
jgi:acetyl esterase/lipase